MCRQHPEKKSHKLSSYAGYTSFQNPKAQVATDKMQEPFNTIF